MRPQMVNFTQAQKHNKSKGGITKLVWEYNFDGSMDAIDIAKTIMTGKYPDTGWASNSVSTMIFYVLSGSATIIFQTGEIFNLKPEDICVIPPNNWYQIEGDCNALMPCAPAWDPKQSIKKV